MLTSQEYNHIKAYSEFGSFYLLWGQCSPISDEISNYSYEENKKIFFEVLSKLLKDGYLKLHKKGKLLEGSIDEQLQKLYIKFPNSEADMEDGLWFYYDNCPAEPAWIKEDGTIEFS
ncbi:DUF596 domain-containing protein [Gilliamella sp. Bif1-4]|jgi:hypothetical protein|uniref:DUF596 domain-containing protein n=1 Tax=Gilliamella sp. Bif1-4 TaxID=3120233 RepID=UPI00080ECA89|nr:DUF596 domain-containing protein [Gilliamella apicola]OCG41149.1 hypothetical protein A9G25_06430 [Gilliamella apicola]